MKESARFEEEAADHLKMANCMGEHESPFL